MLDQLLPAGLHAYPLDAVTRCVRGLSATYVDDAGVLQTAPVDTARYQGGLLVEAESTNLALHSASQSSASWTAYGMTKGVATQAPDGSSTAIELRESALSESHYVQGPSPALVAGKRYVVSVFCSEIPGGTKRYASVLLESGAWGGYRGVSFDVASGAPGSVLGGVSEYGVVPVLGGCRVWVAYTAGSSGVGPIQLRTAASNSATIAGHSGSTTSGMTFWGLMVEQKDAGGPSSYIPTTSAAVTRPADQVYVRAAYPTGLTASERRISGALWLVEAFFAQGTQRWTNWPADLSWNGNTFSGLGELGSVSEVQESTSGLAGKVTLKLSPVDVGLLSLAIGNVEGYRGRPVNIYLWPIDGNYRRVGNPILRHFGVMDQVSIKADGDSGVIELSCLPAGANGQKRAQGLRVSHEQQVLRAPGDRGLEYVASLVNNPQLWLSKAFQEV